jgi:hypothetical protein
MAGGDSAGAGPAESDATARAEEVAGVCAGTASPIAEVAGPVLAGRLGL